jgi:hypothetical protein
MASSRYVPIKNALADKELDTALRLAADKLPSLMEFVTRSSPPRLGRLLITPGKSEVIVTDISDARTAVP